MVYVEYNLVHSGTTSFRLEVSNLASADAVVPPVRFWLSPQSWEDQEFKKQLGHRDY